VMPKELTDALTELKFALAQGLFQPGFGLGGNAVGAFFGVDGVALTEGDGVPEQAAELACGPAETKLPIFLECSDGAFHGGLPLLDDRLGSGKQFNALPKRGVMRIEFAAQVEIPSQDPSPIGSEILVVFLSIYDSDAGIAAEAEDFNLLSIGFADGTRGIDDINDGSALGEWLEDFAFGGEPAVGLVSLEEGAGGLGFDGMGTEPFEGGGGFLKARGIDKHHDLFAIEFNGVRGATNRGAGGGSDLRAVIFGERREDGGFAFVGLSSDDEGWNGGNREHDGLQEGRSGCASRLGSPMVRT
jgi:hypothetical protein